MGTSLPHDELIKAIDKLVGQGRISDEVLAQIGEGNYKPKHIKSFRFKRGLGDYLSQAEVVVSNCGAGTIMENVTKGHRLVVIQNPDITGGHEWELITKMEKGGHLIWCKDIESIQSSIEQAKKANFIVFNPDRLNLKDVLASL